VLVGNHTIIFLVGKGKLSLRHVGQVVEDFYECQRESGRVFSFCELRELVKIRKNPNSFCENPMLDEIRPYALPFLRKENLKREGSLCIYGKEENNI